MERLKTISALTVIFFIVIGAKIFQKQILEYKKYVELAKGQQIIKKEINAKRKFFQFSKRLIEIVDRSEKIIIVNEIIKISFFVNMFF